MLTLGINTATQNESIALLKGKNLIGELSWIGKKDESKKLLPNIEKLLKKHALTLKDINKIAVVVGPGPYSALRIGVTVANTLAYALDAKIEVISTVEMMHARLPQDISAKLLLNAGGRFVSNGSKVIELEPLLTQLSGKKIYGDLSKDQIKQFKNSTLIDDKKLKSFGQVLANGVQLTQVQIATPLYWRAPMITKSNAKHSSHTDRKS